MNFFTRIPRRLYKFRLNNSLIKKYARSRYVRTWLDIWKCRIKHKASVEDYFKYNFYDYSSKKRDTFVTHGRTEKLDKLTPKNIQQFYANKVLFLEEFSEFTKRDWLFLSKISYDEFASFVKKPSSSPQAQRRVAALKSTNTRAMRSLKGNTPSSTITPIGAI